LTGNSSLAIGQSSCSHTMWLVIIFPWYAHL
jgi:hypothetical protein